MWTAVHLGVAVTAVQEDAASLLLQIFPTIERSGHWEKWLVLFETLRTLNLSPDRRIQLLNRLGQLLRKMRRLQQAIPAHQAAEKEAKTINNPQLIAEAWFNLSADYRNQHDYELARHYALQALGIFAQSPEQSKWEAAALNTLGLIELSCGNLDDAEERLRQSLKLWQSIYDPMEQARVLNGLALTLHRKKEFEASLYFYQQAATQLQESSSELDRIELDLNLGALYYDWCKFDQAEICFWRAHAVALRYPGHVYFHAMIANNLGNALRKQNLLDEAEGHLLRAKMLWSQLSDLLMESNTNGTLAALYAQQGDNDKALQLYDQALASLDKFEQSAWARKLSAKFSQARKNILKAAS
ncbi:tetratricopeptide repeat protein [Candidatus Leptofilum sp.]|uniref:tetratricopeptide repeat protein n=1 Tax=Candidatus Leptofilum sp. TaxID=3241576 RepID=UPI003B5CE673